MSERADLAECERWQYRKAAPGCMPVRAFPTEFEIRKAKAAGTGYVTVAGLASSTGSPYEMHDSYGAYTEVIAPGAFSQTLSQSPHVQLLENHAGRSLAATRSGTLELVESKLGLEFSATVNTARSDVRDMVIALEDGAYSECSFAFNVVRQSWSPDGEQRDISEVNMHRGDVSVCNFGANPNTAATVDVERALRRLEAATREGRAVAPADVSILSQALGWLAPVDVIAEVTPRTAMSLDFARMLAA